MKFGLPKLAFKKQLSLLLIVVSIMHFANYLIIPILPVILSIDRYLQPAQIGVIIGTGSLTFQIGSIIGGLISDRIGRKITLIVGALIEAVALFGFGISYTFPLLLLFQSLNGIGGGVFAPTIKAAIAEYAQDSVDDRTTAFSLRGMAAHLGVALGGLIPLILVGFHFKSFFFIASAIYIGLIFISIFFIQNSCKLKDCGNTSFKRYIGLFHNRSFLLFCFITIFVWAVYAQLSLLLPLRASIILKNTKVVGSIWTITSVFVVILQTTISTHVIRRFHLFTSIFFGTFTMGLGIFFIGLSNNYLFLLISASIFVVGEMLMTPTIDSITSVLADKEIIGAYFSVANIIYGIGNALGSFIGGELINIYGITNSLIPWVIILISSIAISLLVLFTRYLPVIKSRF